MNQQEIDAYAVALLRAAEERALAFPDDDEFQEALAVAEEHGYPDPGELLDAHFDAYDDAEEFEDGELQEEEYEDGEEYEDDDPVTAFDADDMELPPGVPNVAATWDYRLANEQAAQEREQEQTLNRIVFDVEAVQEAVGRTLTQGELHDLGLEARRQLDRFGEFDLLGTAEHLLDIKAVEDMTVDEKTEHAVELLQQAEQHALEQPRQATGMEDLTSEERDHWLAGRMEELAELRDEENPVDTASFNDEQREAYIAARLGGYSTGEIADHIRDAIVNAPEQEQEVV